MDIIFEGWEVVSDDTSSRYLVLFKRKGDAGLFLKDFYGGSTHELPEDTSIELTEFSRSLDGFHRPPGVRLHLKSEVCTAEVVGTKKVYWESIGAGVWRGTC